MSSIKEAREQLIAQRNETEKFIKILDLAEDLVEGLTNGHRPATIATPPPKTQSLAGMTKLQAVRAVTARQPMTVRQILTALKAGGYTAGGAHPELGVYAELRRNRKKFKVSEVDGINRYEAR